MKKENKKKELSARSSLFFIFYFVTFHLIIVAVYLILVTAQKMKFSTKDFFSKCDQIRRKLQIWSRLLKKSLMEHFIFCALSYVILLLVTCFSVVLSFCMLVVTS